MKKSVFLLLLLTVLGCKKEPEPIPLPKVTEKVAAGSIAFDSVTLKDPAKTLLFPFYRLQNFHTFWIGKSDREIALEVLKGAINEGLEPTDYHIKKLRKYENRFNDLSEKEIIQYDILLTSSLQAYLSHLAFGKLNPREIYRNWDLKRPQVDINRIIINSVTADSLQKTIQHIAPQHIVYKRLKKALSYINSFPKDTLRKIEITTKIRKNDTMAAIIQIKHRLMFWHDLKRMDSVSNVYDRKTVNAMRKFQLRHGLNPDGVIGAATIQALNFSKTQRKQQLIANMERWRWFPRNMGDEYVIVNIPAYSLRVVRNSDTIDTRRVVVGKEKRRTPVLSSTFSDVILNPTWTVPPTIIKEDLGPDAAKDSSYFTNRRLTIYDSKNNIVSPRKWNPAKPNNYRYVQRPGDDNSLGNVKFNFPNHFTVYLHDTNHRDYFGLNDRSLSSGCVRVQDPLPLAVYIIGDEKYWGLDKINEVIAQKTTTYIKIKRRINFHQLYWTAWMNKRSELEFRTDIYNLDADLYNRLRK